MKKTVFAVCAAAAVYSLADLYRYIFWRSRSRLSVALLDRKGHRAEYYARRDLFAEKLRRSAHETWEMRSERGETLRGFYYPCGEGKSRKIAFIVHGYRSEHAETAGVFMDYYHSRGFDIFTCDNTASGESGGNFIGWDVLESADCLKWLDLLNERLGSVSIVLHGFSLGGGTVLKCSDRVPKSVKFIVSDSGFSDAREILRRQLGPLYGLFSRVNRRLAGYDLADSSVLQNIACAKAPMLIVHGMDDRTVPFSMAPEIFARCPEPKDCLFVPDTRHIEAIHIHPDEYARMLDKFIGLYIGE